MFKVKNPVLHSFLLLLIVLFNSTLSYISQSFRVTKIFLKKILEFGLKQRFYFTLIFVLLLVETNLLIKEKCDKLNIFWLSNTGSIKIIFILLTKW